MGVLWRDVLVPDSVVGSDGLTAEVGGVVAMPLLLDCRHRALLGPDEPAPSVPRVSGAPGEPGGRWVHELVGRVVEVNSLFWTDGWVIDVDGLALYVAEDTPALVPEAGSWVRVRGELSVAQAYETDGFEPADELMRRAERRWHVRRIVRLDDVPGGPGSPSRRHRVEVAVMRFGGRRRRVVGYLLDLEQPDQGWPARVRDGALP